jgi:hypothetical protein
MPERLQGYMSLAVKWVASNGLVELIPEHCKLLDSRTCRAVLFVWKCMGTLGIFMDR